MNIHIRYPSISLGSADEQLRDIRSYLYQLTDALNACDTSALAVLDEISAAINAGENAEAVSLSEEGLRLQEYSSLRSLIIKTADYAIANSESISLSMRGNYVAVSDFGRYFEEATVDIEGTPWGITQLYSYSAGIDAENMDYRTEQENYIKSGLLYYNESSQPVYGVGVGTIYGNFSVYGLTTDTVINNAKTYYTKSGNVYTPVEEPVQSELSTYYERVMSRQSGQMYSTFTADEMAFWSGSTKLAYMNTSSINFPNANITGGSIAIGGTTQSPTFSVSNAGYMQSTSGKIANWNIGTDAIYTDGATYSGTTGMYFGASGLRIGSSFKVSNAGSLTATSGTIANWNINTNSLATAGATYGVSGMYFGSSGLSLGSQFKVDTSGNLTANGATLTNVTASGTITATSLAANATITSPAIYGGAMYAYGDQYTYTSVQSDGYYFYKGGYLKCYIGSLDATNANAIICLGDTNPLYVSKIYSNSQNQAWIGDANMTCGILFNFSAGTYQLVGTPV
ncbi:MAG: hypothetical protein IKZ82_06140 [Clostridia bacterium]|nr:hypothetical protein [Clostridia bacterium]